MSSYTTYALCKCGHRRYAPHGDLFHATVLGEVCGNCGRGIEKHSHIVVSRWVDTSVWWKPSTWDTGYWQDAEKK